MENTLKNEGTEKTNAYLKRGIQIVLLLATAVSVLHMIGFFLMIESWNALYMMYYGVTLAGADLLYQAFMGWVFIAAALIVLAVWLLFINRKKELMAKILVWALFLLTFMKVYTYFSGMFYLSSYTASEGFALVESGMQNLCAAIPLLALVLQWDDKRKKATNTIALVAMVVSAVFLVIKIVNYDWASMAANNIMYDIIGLLVLLFIPVFVFLATRSRRIFSLSVYGMTDEEANLVEGMEDKLEDQKRLYEEEAIQILEKQIEDELKEALVERAVDKVIEDTQQLEKAMEDGIDKLEKEEELGEVLDDVLVSAVGGEDGDEGNDEEKREDTPGKET